MCLASSGPISSASPTKTLSLARSLGMVVFSLWLLSFWPYGPGHPPSTLGPPVPCNDGYRPHACHAGPVRGRSGGSAWRRDVRSAPPHQRLPRADMPNYPSQYGRSPVQSARRASHSHLEWEPSPAPQFRGTVLNPAVISFGEKGP